MDIVTYVLIGLSIAFFLDGCKWLIGGFSSRQDWIDGIIIAVVAVAIWPLLVAGLAAAGVTKYDEWRAQQRRR